LIVARIPPDDSMGFPRRRARWGPMRAISLFILSGIFMRELMLLDANRESMSVAIKIPLVGTVQTKNDDVQVEYDTDDQVEKRKSMFVICATHRGALDGFSQVLAQVIQVIGDVSIRFEDRPKTLNNDELLGKVLNITKGREYDLNSIPLPLKSQVEQSLVDLLNITSSSSNYISYGLVLPELIWLLPFLPIVSEKLGGVDIVPVVVTQDGRYAAFDKVTTDMDQIGLSLIDEDIIDIVCLTHVREYSIANRTDGLRGLHFPPTTKQNRRWGRPCMITDIPILRSGIMWSKAHDTALGFGAGLFVRIEDLIIGSREVVEILEKLFPGHAGVQIGNWIKHNKAYVRHSISPKLQDWRSKGDKNILEDVSLLIDDSVLRRLGYIASNASLILDRRPANVRASESLARDNTTMKLYSLDESLARFLPIKPSRQVDAGTCIQTIKGSRLSEEEKHALTKSAAKCLPTFLLVGAQKAGTDELAVWLNTNIYLRRLDGGVETHFFDCMGRGQGYERLPCSRFRSTKMRFDQKAPSTVFSKHATLSWEAARNQSRYISSWWSTYRALGHQNYVGLKRRHTKNFEKTPAYMDLANPMDVMRFLPSVQLIFMLRDPVKRLVSSYFQICSGMYQTAKNCSHRDLEERLAAYLEDPSRADKEYPPGTMDLHFYRGIKHGFYAHWIDHWRKAFPDNKIMVVFSEQFKLYPVAVANAINDFVGLREDQYCKYKAHQEDNGYWVLGDYSKATHPSHKRDPSKAIMEKIARIYKPWNAKLAQILQTSNIAYTVRVTSSTKKMYKVDNIPTPSWVGFREL